MHAYGRDSRDVFATYNPRRPCYSTTGRWVPYQSVTGSRSDTNPFPVQITSGRTSSNTDFSSHSASVSASIQTEVSSGFNVGLARVSVKVTGTLATGYAYDAGQSATHTTSENSVYTAYFDNGQYYSYYPTHIVACPSSRVRSRPAAHFSVCSSSNARAGQVWQWEWVTICQFCATCDEETVSSRTFDLAHTAGSYSRPCCLPGKNLDANDARSSCAEGPRIC